jgi:hypothetical protein
MTTACSDDSWGVNESDVPPEASLAYPGSHLEQRNWSPSQKGTYIDGGKADSAPELSYEYTIPPTDVKMVSDWYQTQLERLGYSVGPALRPQFLEVNGTKQTDGFVVEFGIIASRSGEITGYQVRVFVTPAGS